MYTRFVLSLLLVSISIRTSADHVNSPVAGKRDAAMALITYTKQLHDAIKIQDAVSATYIAKIREDGKARNLKQYQRDSAQLKDSAIQLQDTISALEWPDVNSEADDRIIDQVQEAAEDYASECLGVAVDLAVEADFGTGAFDELKSDLASEGRARSQLEKAIYKAYEHYGYKRSHISLSTYQPSN
jgi:hypothetical protein